MGKPETLAKGGTWGSTFPVRHPSILRGPPALSFQCFLVGSCAFRDRGRFEIVRDFGGINFRVVYGKTTCTANVLQMYCKCTAKS